MNTYSKGKIYKLVSNVSNKIYIGSTCNPLPKRFNIKWKNGNKGKTTSFELFEDDNMENIEIVLIEQYPCECKIELHKRERHFIETLKCVNKVIPGRNKKEDIDDNREKITKQNREYYEINKDKIQLTMKEYRENKRENKRIL